MNLELTPDEARELKLVVESGVQRLLEELAHADVREFRVSLRRRLEVLQDVDRQLGGLLEPATPLHA